jgi:phospholipase C
VPTIVVSPRVRPGSSHELFDHTSIIKTCLARFCRREGGLIPDMGARVNAANHLGLLLESDVQVSRPGDAELGGLVAELRRWRAESLQEEVAVQSEAVPPDPAALTDFQEDYIAAREAVLDSMTPRERAEAAKALGMTGAS